MTLDDLKELNGLVAQVVAAGKVYHLSRKASDYYQYMELYDEAKAHGIEIPKISLTTQGPKEIA